ncbi:MAG: hypothetical protein M3Y42_11290 [Actinomycetota bacterium]|nr:hypothetical protein [Actinomycetota bacterium]
MQLVHLGRGPGGSRFSGRLAVLLALSVAILLAGTTSAYAYLRTTGRGSGTAQAGTLQVQVQSVTLGDTNAGRLLPGQRADAVVKVHNPNQVDVQLSAVTGNGTVVASNGCAPTGVSFTDQTGLSTVIAAGATVLVPLPGSVAMSDASAAACQGATFAIGVSVTVRS